MSPSLPIEGHSDTSQREKRQRELKHEEEERKVRRQQESERKKKENEAREIKKRQVYCDCHLFRENDLTIAGGGLAKGT